MDCNLSVIPDKFKSKAPAIKNWTEYAKRLPTSDELSQWCSFDSANIALITGKLSGVVALDLDSIDPAIEELILPLIPESPCTRIGSKGWVKFYKFGGESSAQIKLDDKVILEILSDNKKVTLPPSVHPLGMEYKWVTKNLIECLDKLPMLPPLLVANVQDRLRQVYPTSFQAAYGVTKTDVSGRNSALYAYAHALIDSDADIVSATRALVAKDLELYPSSPYFSDKAEGNLDAELCATAMLVDALRKKQRNSVSTGKHKKLIKLPEKTGENSDPKILNSDFDFSKMEIGKTNSENLEIPKAEKKLDFPKEPKKQAQKNEMYLTPFFRDFQQYILRNSYAPQPAMAVGSILSIVATLASRKYFCGDSAANLYTLLLAPSGAGKNIPIQLPIHVLTEIGASSLIGHAHYGSDISFIQHLPDHPVRLDCIDEASVMFAASAQTHYAKINEYLMQLYTSSNQMFTGIVTATHGVRARIFKPHVNELWSTTPTALKKCISRDAIATGLLGRFLIFTGERVPNQFILSREPLPLHIKGKLSQLFQTVSQKQVFLGPLSNYEFDVPVETQAQEDLRSFFQYCEDRKQSLEEDHPLQPVLARTYAHAHKIALLGACAESGGFNTLITSDNVKMAASIARINLDNFETLIEKWLEPKDRIELRDDILSYIRARPVTGERELSKRFGRSLRKHRESNLADLCQDGLIQTFLEDGKLFYKAVRGEENIL